MKRPNDRLFSLNSSGLGRTLALSLLRAPQKGKLATGCVLRELKMYRMAILHQTRVQCLKGKNMLLWPC